MKNSDLRTQLLVLIAFGLLALVVGACASYSILFPLYWTERLPISNASGQMLTITDYRYSSNVSYKELTAFLANDTTYLTDYNYPSYTCGDFAVRLHDDAEAHGIRSGVVGVTFNVSGNADVNDSGDLSVDHNGRNISDPGHGFNVFNTTDRGLVYVDATGITRSAKELEYEPHIMAVYMKQGLPLGEIELGQAESLDYAYYQQRDKQYQAYVQNVSQYLHEASNYSRKTDTLNDTYNTYEKDLEVFDVEYDNFSAELNDSNGSNAITPGSSMRLESQREMLANELDDLNARLDAIQDQSLALDAEEKLLAEKRASLEQDEADQTIIIAQWGVVDRVVVFW